MGQKSRLTPVSTGRTELDIPRKSLPNVDRRNISAVNVSLRVWLEL